MFTRNRILTAAAQLPGVSAGANLGAAAGLGPIGLGASTGLSLG